MKSIGWILGFVGSMILTVTNWRIAIGVGMIAVGYSFFHNEEKK